MTETQPIDMPYFPFEDVKSQEFDLSAFVGDDPTQRALLDAWRKKIRGQLDLSAYDDPDRAWYRNAFFERFAFMYDRGFYDPERGCYRIDEYLDEGEREFGGPDILLLWQSYPRLGIDRRNQFDLYREMPGGLPGLKALTDRCHARGVRVFLNYNPWDTGTRREESSDGEALAGILAATGADGVFLDTMWNSPADFRTPLLEANPACVFDPEAIPETQDLQIITGSWLQVRGIFPPVIPTIRWLEPRFTLRGIARSERSRKPILHRDLFLGGGHVIWENLFGFFNPWNAEDRTLVRKIARVLRACRAAFAHPDWQPLIGTLIEGVYANRWPDGNRTVYTLYNGTDQAVNGPALALPPAPGMRAWDLLSGEPLRLVSDESGALLSLTLPPREATAVLVQPETEPPPDVGGDRVSLEQYTDDTTGIAGHMPRPVAPTPPAPAKENPSAMAMIPGGRFVMRVRAALAVGDARRQGGSSGGVRGFERRPRLRALGRQAAAARGGVAICRAGNGRPAVAVGERSGRTGPADARLGAGQPPSRVREPAGYDEMQFPFQRYHAGGALSSRRVAVRRAGHGRQCLGMDRKRARRRTHALRDSAGRLLRGRRRQRMVFGFRRATL
jgi:gamma-glutamyl hercynylcysteine S-oxide synthase